jgi:hypothetical protein
VNVEYEAITSLAVRRLFIDDGEGEESLERRIPLGSLELREEWRERGRGTGYCNMSGYRLRCLLALFSIKRPRRVRSDETG